MTTIIQDLELDRFARHGGLGGEPLRRFTERYLGTIINLHQPGYHGFVITKVGKNYRASSKS